MNDSDIFVSVMITYYNQKQYIKDSLSSILNQEINFRYEIICGDDGSSDGTYEELLAWKEKYPDLISVYQMDRQTGKTYEPIVRASNNRFNMLCHAKGKYITILDGDDYYTDKMKLQKQVDILEAYPECSACCHPMTMVWEGEPGRKENLGKWSDKSFLLDSKIYWESFWLPAEAFLFRNFYMTQKNKINRNLFDDNLITIYSIKEGDIIYIPDSMCAYRQHLDSSWNERNEIEKAYVNMMLYQEASRILPNMKRQCFYRCNGVFKVFYRYRNEDLTLNKDLEFKVTNKMYQDSVKYKDASLRFKLVYLIRYFLPSHMGKIVALKKKINQRRFKYL